MLSLADLHAIALTAPRFGETDTERMLGLAFAVRAPRISHPGVDLTTIARQADPETAEPADIEDADRRADCPLPWPSDAAAWAKATFNSPMVGEPTDHLKPFVRQPRGGRGGAPLLLTRRMYVEQQRVAKAIAERRQRLLPESSRLSDLEAVLATLFAHDVGGEAARAVRLAATKPLALIVGGPGTGKTYSVTRLLAALLQGENNTTAPLTVALAAPTGKAAARMREAIREATALHASPPLAVADPVRARLQSLTASTLHRLLGIRPDGSARHDATNPIPAQLVVVDEVSMIDLTLMRRLLEAVHPEARLVLLGDRDQLASVEAGCVLADLVPTEGSGPLAANIQTFTRSRRFESAPDIALIAACLQSYATGHPDVPRDDSESASELAMQIFVGERHATRETWPRWRIEQLGEPEFTAGVARLSRTQLARLAEPYLRGTLDLSTAPTGATEPTRLPGYAAAVAAALGDAKRLNDPQWQRELLGLFDRYRVLAVHRRGPLGVRYLDKELARLLRMAIERDQPTASCKLGDYSHEHWIGRPILITENAYDVGLMNGDVGIVLELTEGPAAVFAHETQGVRAVALSRLPQHEGALAMTVHKSQGSQFDHVTLVLAGRDSSIQTRELVYTGVTRARQRLSWLGTRDELRSALTRQVRRESGLPALLTAKEISQTDSYVPTRTDTPKDPHFRPK